MPSASIYNEKRRIIFSTFHKHGAETAFQYLEGYQRALGPAGYIGLRAELEFYVKYRKEFSLTVAGDMGEHADFAGVMGRAPVRFDVTTNKSYKKLREYEKFVCDGFDYKIAIFDQANWEIIDVLELSFPKCSGCGDSFIFSLALLHPMNYNRRGDPLWHNDQEIIDFCPCCGIQKSIPIFNTTVRTYTEIYNDASSFIDDSNDDGESVNEYVINELRSSVKFLEKESGANIVGLAEEGIRQMSKYHNEEGGIYFPYLSDVIRREFPDFYEM